VSNLVDSEGKPHFKYVVEGANLFFTQQSRLWLEKKGVVLFKDSSTNKVGLIQERVKVYLANDARVGSRRRRSRCLPVWV
jgi:glutamate dehydrogenase